MTVRTTIKIDGDSSDAVAAVNGVSTAFRAAAPPVESFTRGALKMTAGVLGAESAVAGLRLVVHSLGESVRAYAESNDAAGEAFSILGGHVDQARVRLGEFIIGGGNAEIVAGALATTIDRLSLAMGGAEGAQSAVRTSLAALLDVMATGAQVVALGEWAYGTMRATLAGLIRVQESAAAGVTYLGTVILDALLVPVDAVTSSIRGLAGGLAAMGGVIGGPVAEVTRTISDAWVDMDSQVGAVRDRLDALSETMGRGVVGAFDGLGGELMQIGQQTEDAFARWGQLGDDIRATADAVRDGTAALAADDTVRRASTAGIAAQTEAVNAATLARSALTAEEIKAKMLAIPTVSGDGAKSAAALEAQKAAAAAAADMARAASAEAAAARIQAALDAEAAAYQRRVDAAQGTGAAVGEALATGVAAQRGATQQIVAIIARELQARITAAIAASAIFGATPGGQFAAAALVAAIGVATSALTSIGGRAGGRGGGGGGGAPTQTINVSVYGGSGGGMPGDDFVDAVVNAVQQGVRRGMVMA